MYVALTYGSVQSTQHGQTNNQSTFHFDFNTHLIGCLGIGGFEHFEVFLFVVIYARPPPSPASNTPPFVCRLVVSLSLHFMQIFASLCS